MFSLWTQANGGLGLLPKGCWVRWDEVTALFSTLLSVEARANVKGWPVPYANTVSFEMWLRGSFEMWLRISSGKSLMCPKHTSQAHAQPRVLQ
eukprot:1140465-Pelagomonas_calceolata.AAC.2